MHVAYYIYSVRHDNGQYLSSVNPMMLLQFDFIHAFRSFVVNIIYQNILRVINIDNKLQKTFT